MEEKDFDSPNTETDSIQRDIAARGVSGLAYGEALREERILDQAGGVDPNMSASGHEELVEAGLITSTTDDWPPIDNVELVGLAAAAISKQEGHELDKAHTDIIPVYDKSEDTQDSDAKFRATSAAKAMQPDKPFSYKDLPSGTAGLADDRRRALGRASSKHDSTPETTADSTTTSNESNSAYEDAISKLSELNSHRHAGPESESRAKYGRNLNEKGTSLVYLAGKSPQDGFVVPDELAEQACEALDRGVSKEKILNVISKVYTPKKSKFKKSSNKSGRPRRSTDMRLF